MGNMQAREIASLTKEGMIDEDTALQWHLQSNHFPPIPFDFVSVAKQALKLARDNDYDTVITMPNDIDKTVGDIIEGMHLDTFL